MGLFDDIGGLINKGVDSAGKQTRKLKLQSDLAQLDNRKNEALVALACAVLGKEGSTDAFRARYASEIQAIADIESKEAALKKQIEDLSREGMPLGPLVQEHACPACGKAVTLDSRFCPACGDNLAALKAQFRVCPACGIYYSADSRYCEECGAVLVEPEVAEKIVVPQEVAPAKLAVPDPLVELASCDDAPAEPDASDTLPASAEPAPVAPAEPAVCASCGAPLKEGARFCALCGAAV